MNNQDNIELIADKIMEIIDTLLQTPHKKWPVRPVIVQKILEVIIDIEFKDTISDYILIQNYHIVYLHKHQKVIVFLAHGYILSTYVYLKQITIENDNGNRVYVHKVSNNATHKTSINFREGLISYLPITIKRIKDQCTNKK